MYSRSWRCSVVQWLNRSGAVILSFQVCPRSRCLEMPLDWGCGDLYDWILAQHRASSDGGSDALWGHAGWCLWERSRLVRGTGNSALGMENTLCRVCWPAGWGTGSHQPRLSDWESPGWQQQTGWAGAAKLTACKSSCTQSTSWMTRVQAKHS